MLNRKHQSLNICSSIRLASIAILFHLNTNQQPTSRKMTRNLSLHTHKKVPLNWFWWQERCHFLMSLFVNMEYVLWMNDWILSENKRKINFYTKQCKSRPRASTASSVIVLIHLVLGHWIVFSWESSVKMCIFLCVLPLSKCQIFFLSRLTSVVTTSMWFLGRVCMMSYLCVQISCVTPICKETKQKQKDRKKQQQHWK